MEQIDLHLPSDIPYHNPQANLMMIREGHMWGKGLGSNAQGIVKAINPRGNKQWQGLVYSFP